MGFWSWFTKQDSYDAAVAAYRKKHAEDVASEFGAEVVERYGLASGSTKDVLYALVRELERQRRELEA